MEGKWYEETGPTKEDIIRIIKEKYDLKDKEDKKKILELYIKKNIINNDIEYGSWRGFYTFYYNKIICEINKKLDL